MTRKSLVLAVVGCVSISSCKTRETSTSKSMSDEAGEEEAREGDGFDLLSKRRHESCFEEDSIKSEFPVNGSKAQAVNGEVQLVTSHKELAQKLSVTAHMELGFVVGSIDASMGYLDTFKSNSNTLYFAGSLDVKNAAPTLKNPKLRADVAQLLTDGDFEAFRAICGTHYVTTVYNGGRMNVLITVSTKQNESVEDLKTKVEGSYVLFSAGAEVQSNQREFLKDRAVNIKISTKGGSYNINTGLDGLHKEFAEFSKRVASGTEKAWPFEIATASYASLGSKNSATTLAKFSASGKALNFLSELSDRSLEYRNLLSLLETARLNLDRYDETNLTMTEKTIAAKDARKKLKRFAISCVDDSICDEDEFSNFPDDPMRLWPKLKTYTPSLAARKRWEGQWYVNGSPFAKRGNILFDEATSELKVSGFGDSLGSLQLHETEFGSVRNIPGGEVSASLKSDQIEFSNGVFWTRLSVNEGAWYYNGDRSLGVASVKVVDGRKVITTNHLGNWGEGRWDDDGVLRHGEPWNNNGVIKGNRIRWSLGGYEWTR